MSLRPQWVGAGVISHSGSQGALADGVLAADRLLSAGTVHWAGLCVGCGVSRQWCLWPLIR